MKKIYTRFIFLALVLMVSASCEKWDLERTNPYDGHPEKAPRSGLSLQGFFVVDAIDDQHLMGQENFKLLLYYRNIGNIEIKNLKAKLTFDAAKVSLQTEASAASVPAGQPFELEFNGKVLLPENAIENVPCYINATDGDGNSWTDTVMLNVHKGSLHLDYLEADPDKPYSPGSETFYTTVTLTIHNLGVATKGLKGTVKSMGSQSGIYNGNSAVNFGNLETDQNSYNTNPPDKKIMIYVEPEVKYGTALPYQITLTDALGRTWTKDFLIHML